MASAGNTIDSFNYAELSQNYDPIYDTLVNGGVVWMHLNYNNTDADWPYAAGEDGYIRFMVTQWAVIPGMGLVIPCPDGDPLVFPNGSHHTVQPK
jgi:hypothetical protein